MKKPIIIVFLLLFAVLLCSCSSGALTQDAFKDGKNAPQLNVSDIQSVKKGFTASDARETFELTEKQIGRFVALFNESTVRILKGETTPDYYLLVELKNGTSFRIEESETNLAVYFTRIAEEATFTQKNDIKIESSDLKQFIEAIAQGNNA